MCDKAKNVTISSTGSWGLCARTACDRWDFVAYIRVFRSRRERTCNGVLAPLSGVCCRCVPFLRSCPLIHALTPPSRAAHSLPRRCALPQSELLSLMFSAVGPASVFVYLRVPSMTVHATTLLYYVWESDGGACSAAWWTCRRPKCATSSLSFALPITTRPKPSDFASSLSDRGPAPARSNPVQTSLTSPPLPSWRPPLACSWGADGPL